MPNREMLLIPGPTPVADEIYSALSGETLGHTDPRFVKIFANSLQMTKQMFNTDGEVFIVAGSGTLAMEMAVVNTVAPGEKLLVISQGYFGDRFIQLGEAFGIEVDTLQSKWGNQIDPDTVRAKLQTGSYKAVTVTHVDTSTGVIADLETLVPIIKQSGALFILDGVCATAAAEENMGRDFGQPEYKIDVVLTGSQKAIGIPPGLGIVAFGPNALSAREAMPRISAYYADIKNWLPIMQNPGKYYATPPVNMIYAYEKGMQMLLAEGLEARYRRHTALGKAVRAALQIYGMQPLALEDAAAPTLSCVLYPEGTDDAAFRSALAAKGVVVAGALGTLAGKAFRIGHMGNVTGEMFEKAVSLIGETLNEQGISVNVETAVRRFNEVYKAV